MFPKPYNWLLELDCDYRIKKVTIFFNGCVYKEKKMH